MWKEDKGGGVMNTRKVNKSKKSNIKCEHCEAYDKDSGWCCIQEKKEKLLEQMQRFHMASQILRRWSNGEINKYRFKRRNMDYRQ